MLAYVIKYYNEEGRVYQTDYLTSRKEFVSRYTDIYDNKSHLRVKLFVSVNGTLCELAGAGNID